MNLKLLCGHSTPRPMLRSYRGVAWTVATNGHALLAVKGRLCRSMGGPDLRQCVDQQWRNRLRVDWKRLREFLATAVDPLPDSKDMEPVDINGVRLNRLLAAKFTRGLKAETVTISSSASTLDGVPAALRIDGPDWFVVVMGARVDVARATYRLRV